MEALGQDGGVPWDPATRPGWSRIVRVAAHMAAPDESDEADEEDECDRRELLPPVILGGKLALAAEDPPRQTLGMFAAARALSAETCALCGGKGDPVADADGQPAGCRCSRCREPGAIVLAPTGIGRRSRITRRRCRRASRRRRVGRAARGSRRSTRSRSGS